MGSNDAETGRTRAVPSAAKPEAPPPADPAEPTDTGSVSAVTHDAFAQQVGHAINNPLAVLFANLDLAVELLGDERKNPGARTRALVLLSDVRQAAERVQAVVQSLLPTRAPPAVQPPRLSEGGALTEASGRRARVVVVDDEVLVGTALQRILRDCDVVVFDNAKDALASMAAGERFDVLFCDLMMPQMTGMDLHAAVRRIAPDMSERMVFMTGAAVTTRARDFVATVANAVIDKPFDVTVLREIVRARMANPRR